MNPSNPLAQFPAGVIVDCDGLEEWERLCEYVRDMGGYPISFSPHNPCTRIFYNDYDELKMLRGTRGFYINDSRYKKYPLVTFSELEPSTCDNVLELFEGLI